MKKLNKILGSRGVTLSLFVLAGLLLVGSTVGGTQAALAEFSETYTAEFEQKNIGVTLMEDDKAVAGRDFVENSNAQWSTFESELLGSDWQIAHGITDKDPIKLGTTYPYHLSVYNSGTIPEYVRVSVYKYWMHQKADGTWEKDTGLDPDLIHIDWATGNGWTISGRESTKERTVLYYGPKLAPEASSDPLTESFTIDSDLNLKVKETVTGNVVEVTYEYDGYKFMIEATVDAVQDHNFQDAMRSSWGTTGPTNP